MKNEIENYFHRLWPINRSLTGNGNRETLKILSEIIPLNVYEIPSGTQCFDWIVPPEWNVNEAWIKDESDNVLIDFKVNNLHLLGYSEPIDDLLSFQELKKNIFTLPDQPNLIPYLTSYYKKRWGFCMSHDQYIKLDDKINYKVKIDSKLDEDGSMTIADLIIKGKSDKEIIFSTYICHPSLANNELSGPLVTAFIYNKLKDKELYYTYRFIFVPETIGTISYLSIYGNELKQNVVGGFVVTCIGDNRGFTYKRSRKGNSLVDRAVEVVLKQTEEDYKILEFSPIGSDERQYCSPGFNLPIGSLMRTKYGEYPEYHTSGDNIDFISFEAMENSVLKFLDIINLIEKNFKYINRFPNCEPQLGKRGLYPSLGSQKKKAEEIEAMMWILNYTDGNFDLIDIIEKSKIDFKILLKEIDRLIENDIIEVALSYESNT